MNWRAVAVVFLRCEFKAGYNYLTGWQLSAKGALPIVMVTLCFLILYCKV
jgi:endonuclease V-like protein UPF0215 family